MSETDFDHISKLFTIIDGCVNHSGKFGAIQNEAFTQLTKVNDQLRQNQLQKKEADERALAEHKHRQAKLKADEDEKQEEANNAAPAAKPKSIAAQNIDNQAADAESRANATKTERESEEAKAKEHSNLGLDSDTAPESHPQYDLSGKPIENEATNGNPNVPIDRRI